VVQVFKVLILLSALFLHLWLQCLNKVFDSRNSCGLLLYPICHLRSSSQWLFNFHSLGNWMIVVCTGMKCIQGLLFFSFMGWLQNSKLHLSSVFIWITSCILPGL
jgi:hypothetical protein